MHRVVITGRGIVSPIGIGLKDNTEALISGISGVSKVAHWEEINLKSHVGGRVTDEFDCPLIDKKVKRYASANTLFAIAATSEAVSEAGLSKEYLSSGRVAIINGCAGSACVEIYNSTRQFVENNNNVKRVTPFVVPKSMPSSAVANLSLIFGIKGESYDISAACSSGSLAIIMGCRLIKSGMYDTVIVGGSEEANWVQTLGFDAMRALSRNFNSTPEQASRPFDTSRDGFVIAEGAGMLVLESEEAMLKRGGKPIAYLDGVSANSNAHDMVVPEPQSNIELMSKAIAEAGIRAEDIDYINTHGTSTPVGDPVELESIRQLFGTTTAFNSTKSQTGHMVGATGAAEAIFTTIMMENSFISPSLNVESIEPGYEKMNLVTTTTQKEINYALSNSFAFGGSNACLLFAKN